MNFLPLLSSTIIILIIIFLSTEQLCISAQRNDETTEGSPLVLFDHVSERYPDLDYSSASVILQLRNETAARNSMIQMMSSHCSDSPNDEGITCGIGTMFYSNATPGRLDIRSLGDIYEDASIKLVICGVLQQSTNSAIFGTVFDNGAAALIQVSTNEFPIRRKALLLNFEHNGQFQIPRIWHCQLSRSETEIYCVYDRDALQVVTAAMMKLQVSDSKFTFLSHLHFDATPTTNPCSSARHLVFLEGWSKIVVSCFQEKPVLIAVNPQEASPIAMTISARSAPLNTAHTNAKLGYHIAVFPYRQSHLYTMSTGFAENHGALWGKWTISDLTIQDGPLFVFGNEIDRKNMNDEYVTFAFGLPPLFSDHNENIYSNTVFLVSNNGASRSFIGLAQIRPRIYAFDLSLGDQTSTTTTSFNILVNASKNTSDDTDVYDWTTGVSLYSHDNHQFAMLSSKYFNFTDEFKFVTYRVGYPPVAPPPTTASSTTTTTTTTTITSRDEVTTVPNTTTTTTSMQQQQSTNQSNAITDDPQQATTDVSSATATNTNSSASFVPSSSPSSNPPSSTNNNSTSSSVVAATSSSTTTDPNSESPSITTNISTMTTEFNITTNSTTTASEPTTLAPPKPVPGKVSEQVYEASSASANVVAGIASISGGSPAAAMTVSRALSSIQLVGCSPTNQNGQEWLRAPLAFPMSYFPSSFGFGSELGFHVRGALVSLFTFLFFILMFY